MFFYEVVRCVSDEEEEEEEEEEKRRGGEDVLRFCVARPRMWLGICRLLLSYVLLSH